VQNNLLSQNSTINESIYAAYLNYSSRWKSIGYQAGMRYEESHLKGASNFDNATFGYDYPKGTNNLLNSLFPSLYLSNKFNQNSEIQINFSRKIGRPNFMQIMPIIMGIDRQNIRVGNPALQPEFVNLAELNYNQLFGGNNWLISGYFMHETNTIKPFASISATDPNLLVTTFINGKYEDRYGLDNTLKLALGKQVDFTTNFNLFNVAIVTETTNNSGWAYNGKGNLNIKLPKSFSVQLNGNYESDRIIPQGYRKATAFMDFAVKKSFFGGAANITFSVNDVFDSRKEVTTYLFPKYYQENMRRRDLRYFKLSLQMPFGKMDASIFKRAKEGRKQGQGQGDMDFGG
jgi:outer membrane receptor protein involved in Fe transport